MSKLTDKFDRIIANESNLSKVAYLVWYESMSNAGDTLGGAKFSESGFGFSDAFKEMSVLSVELMERYEEVASEFKTI